MTEYRNEADMKTKREMLSQDRKANTYFEQASATMGQELGGRFQHLARGQQQVVGSTPNAYPRIPSGPWSEPCPTGIEPPLGYSLSAAPDLGEPSLAQSCVPTRHDPAPTPQIEREPKTFRRRF
jgi:hypothetical protein